MNKEMCGRRHIHGGETVDEDADALGEDSHGVLVHTATSL